jgi:hypothetical protein
MVSSGSSVETVARGAQVGERWSRILALPRLHPRLLPALVGSVLAGPSVAWAAIDRSIWAWDMAGYGIASVQLWASLRLDPGSWLSALTHTRVWRPPAIFWLGEFFVPLRHVVGSVQVALLLSVELTLAATLALLFVACRRVADGRALPALAGTLVPAGAPLLVSISHQYMAETIQTASVVWVLFVMVSARRWHPSLTAVQLAAALSFGLLTKITTPLYTAGPAFIAVVFAVRALGRREQLLRWRTWTFAVSALGAALLVFATAFWYARNFTPAWQLARFSTESPLYGPPASFTSRLSSWLSRLGDGLFLPYVDFALVALLLIGAFGLVVGRRRLPSLRHADRWLVLAGCLGAVLPVLLSLASQRNTIVRFLVPSMPAIGLGLTALLLLLGVRRLAAAATLVLTAQFVLLAVQSFVADVPAQIYEPLRMLPTARSGFARQLDRVIHYTCLHTPYGKTNVVAADYASLSANTANFLALQQFIAGGCSWTNLGSAPTDPRQGWEIVTDNDAPFILTFDFGNPENPLPPQIAAEVPAYENVNVIDVAVLRQARRSGRYTVVPAFRRAGLLLLRRTP